ncbi:glycosyltransferase family 2 protein [Rhodopirellula sp. JC737]|nr:glycosyltransferase family 2 protein [Rhodopirellula sp. JC737]
MNDPIESSESIPNPSPQIDDALVGDAPVNLAPNVPSDSNQSVDFPTPDYWFSDDYVAQMHRTIGPDACRKLAIYRLPEGFRLSVIVPVYNECSTVQAVLQKLRDTGLPLQIIVVDDGSNDGSSETLKQFKDDPLVTLMQHAENRGKGAAIRTAIEVTQGDVVVIQDADSEYDPGDFRVMLQPLLAGEADIVYGTRYGHCDRQVSPWWHQAVNGFISWLASVAIGPRLSDVETCYKMARRESFRDILPDLKENRFGIEIEVTARWARKNLRFTERPIRYHHRWYDEGKKITWRDGVAALGCIFKYGLLKR